MLVNFQGRRFSTFFYSCFLIFIGTTETSITLKIDNVNESQNEIPSLEREKNQNKSDISVMIWFAAPVVMITGIYASEG